MSTTVAPPSSRGLPRGLAPLRRQNYRLFFAGNLIPVIGSWMQTTAQSWLVVSTTAAAFKLGLLLLPIMGFTMTSTMSMANTTIQLVTPHELRGRVLSVYLTVFAGSAPFGALLSGAIANEFGRECPSRLAVW